MATEAQRLINISLGKIASSKSQRGGIRLHKSLMVANIIVQARTQAMMEFVTSPTKSQSPPTSNIDNIKNVSETNFELRSSSSHDAFRNSASEFDSDSESSLGSDDEMSVDFELDFGKIEESDLPTSRKRKRSGEDDLDVKPAKKFIPSPELCSLESDGNNLTNVECANSLLDSLQMCHLTQDLNSRFASQSVFEDHDFSKINHSDDNFDMSTSDFIKAQPVFESQAFNKMSSTSDSYDMSLDDTDYNKDISLFQTEGLGEVISCSTQIREALETLTRPVISLTV